MGGQGGRQGAPGRGLAVAEAEPGSAEINYCRLHAASKSRDLYFANLARPQPDVGQTCVSYGTVTVCPSVRYKPAVAQYVLDCCPTTESLGVI